MLNDLHVLAISDKEENISFSDDETVDTGTRGQPPGGEVTH